MQIRPSMPSPLLVSPDSKAQANTQSSETPEDMAVTAASRMLETSDEMSAALSQFMRSRKPDGRLEEHMSDFEKVLEGDVLPRAQQVLAAAKMSDRPIEWLLQQARQLFGDDSDLVLVLRELLRQKNLAEASRERIEQMLRVVMSQASPKRLKAGINCALKARLFGKTLAMSAALLRETYRSFLESDSGPVPDYEDWIALYGCHHRSSVLMFVEASLLTDIDAQDPSCTRAEFGDLLGRLGQLKRLRSADRTFVMDLLANEWLHGHGIGEAQLLILMLGLLRYPDELDDLLEGGIGDALFPVSHAERSCVLGALQKAAARLPVELFSDEQAPLRLMERFMTLADITFAREAVERLQETDRAG
ncbi:type III secretion system gatekeeper subunit SctW [Pseudomonas sp. NPDC090202]|uniref:type III secretion system gatekeeper subunit SctW n=1 Tax=unclassified Pseudomonas TaxID=196821 RepID=UPI003823CEC3